MTIKEAAPNVLLVVLDSVRAQNCSLYGYDHRTTPFLESMAAESVVYTQARAPSNWTLPSHVSLFTGIETHAHKVTLHDRLKSGTTIFEELADRGYTTGLFTENGFLAEHGVGLNEAFQSVSTVPDTYAPKYDTTEINPGPDGFYYADAFKSWRNQLSGPWAACLNLMDAHRPFEPRTEFDYWGDSDARELQADLPNRWEWEFYNDNREDAELNQLQRLYDGGIRQADAILEQVITALKTDGVLDNTLVVVCGDHGDGFGERGLITAEPRAVSHIVPMNESLLHVPLVVRPPGGIIGHKCHHPAALTAFPTVVRNTIENTTRPFEFATDQVLSSKQPITDDLRQRFQTRCVDPQRFYLPSRAVYVSSPSDGHAIRKQYFWGDKAIECRIDKSGNITRLGEMKIKQIQNAFDSPEVSVREPLSGEQVTESAKEQLSALGYY